MKYSIRKYEVAEVDYKRHVDGGKVTSIDQLEDNVLATLSEYGGKANNEEIIAEYATLEEAQKAFEAYTEPTEDKKPTIAKANVVGNKCNVEFFALVESTENEDEYDEACGGLLVNTIDDSRADFLYSSNIYVYKED